MTKKLSQSGLVVFAVILIFLLVPMAGAFEVYPSNPTVGDHIIVSGYTDRTGSVPAKVVFTSDVPVNDGTYKYTVSGVEIPSGPNSFLVEASGVNDLKVEIKAVFWWTVGHPSASNGIASVSASNVPEHTYSVKMSGEAQPDKSNVEIKISASSAIDVTDGYYEYEYSTSSMPEGDFTLTVDGESKTIYLAGTSTPSGSSGGSSGSGGSIGTSPDMAAKNVVTSESTNLRVVSGMPAGCNFDDPLNPVTYIGFTSGITSRNVPITIEILEHTSASVSESPEGIAYKNINIWLGYTGFSSSENILNASLKFKVDSTWLEENSIDLGGVVLMHYNASNDGWEAVSTELIEVRDGYAYYKALPESFSPFAIVGMEEIIPEDVEDLPNDVDVLTDDDVATEVEVNTDDTKTSSIDDLIESKSGITLLSIVAVSILGLFLFFKARK
ncbi:PGF-pre-PGF domain-containing protein [Methanococcoides vulcani]|uniref:PGF-pre-PGF domain-containing protein n=1 Tax=Methanococcoides vulcani TaxID=1353158 RepID=UPI0014384530|nr:PGF-pre-PGF domain-containing protein [Methanococcoides vulcani]